MAKASAGLCLWRWSGAEIEVFIVHPGGPFWAKKDDGAWSFPKGEFDPGTEAGLDAALREFAEETGAEPPAGETQPLGETKLKSGKRVLVWALEGDLDAEAIVSNTFEMEWPPRSGKRQAFPEVDRAQWCSPTEAAAKLNPAQVVFVDRLIEHLRSSDTAPDDDL